MTSRFDEIARTLASGLSRRQALWRIGGIFGGAALGLVGLTGRAAADTLLNCNTYCNNKFTAIADRLMCRQKCLNTPSSGSLCGTTAASLVACTGGQTCVNNACACPGGTTFCSGGCINTGADPNNCGACGSVCSGTHMATRTCSGGVCNGTCASGYADCDGNKQTNGCEVNLTTDPNNCGACGSACSSFNMATISCGGGVCNGTCASGYADCDGNKRANGCETFIAGDTNNCGGCGTTCGPYANGTAYCSNGSCAVFCNYGYGNCDGNVSNGCETPLLNDHFNCGACGRVCGPFQSCVNGNCL